MVSLLPSRSVIRWRATPVTARMGQEFSGEFRRIRRERLISQAAFENVVERLMTWSIHERAGLSVAASSDRPEVDAIVVLRLGLGKVSVDAPCRVVEMLCAEDRVGFSYATLLGHPECGVETFTVERRGPQVGFVVEAFSRPKTRLARWSGPVGRWVQDDITRRYLRAAGEGPNRGTPDR